MWKKIEAVFRGFPAQRKVAIYLLEKGLQVKESGRIACDGCDIPSTSLARRLEVDRRVIDSAAAKIRGDEDLRRVYAELRPIAFLKDTAPEIGLGVISISVKDASKPGIIGGIAECIARHGVTIRQAVAEDTYFVDDPKFIVITAEKVRGDLLEDLKNLRGVDQITIS